ncbi:LAMI_0B07140g1_1 [Lachancea mirantina]|uniref:LAMI_0B07140g1_1 n=1 Tax=Lachancea mirantina TaxID=1230905 RepID=A0A1G4IX28_9SACH|nr:LAMI_0B07140g1_1 [Lachancea mirantina]
MNLVKSLAGASGQWQHYLMDNVPYLGQVIECDLIFIMCRASSSEIRCIQIGEPRVKEQALTQGFDESSTSDLYTRFLAAIRVPTDDLHIYKQANSVAFELCVTQDIRLHLKFKCIDLHPETRIQIYRSIACSRTRDVNFMNSAFQSLLSVITRKDEALRYLKDTIKDLGYNSVLQKWAPPGSLNEIVSDEFEVERWCRNYVHSLLSSTQGLNSLSSAEKNSKILTRLYSEVHSCESVTIKGRRRLSGGLNDVTSMDSFQDSFNSLDEGATSVTDESQSTREEGNEFNSAPRTSQQLLPPVEEETLSEGNEAGSGAETSPSKKKRRFGKIKSDD